MGDTHKSLMKKKRHWRIMNPTPAYYNNSVGSTMLQTVINWANLDAVPIYHEVFLEEHRDWMLNWGFQVEKEVVVSQEPFVKIWVMIKEANRGTISEIGDASSIGSGDDGSDLQYETIEERMLEEMAQKEEGTLSDGDKE